MVFGFDLGFSSKKNSSKGEYSNEVVTPEWWKTGVEGLNTSIGDFAKTYGYGNVSPDQQGAMTTLAGLNSARVPDQIEGDTRFASDFLTRNVNPALQGIANNFTPLTQANYSVQGATPQVSAETGYTMAQPYRDAYGTGVLDPALADYDAGTARAANAFRAGSIGGGGGQAFGSQPVAAGVLAADAARGRGALSASIRTDLLDKSFGFGGADAGRKLTADTTSAGFQQQDRMANLDASMRADQMRTSALGQQAGLVQQMGDNAVTGAGTATAGLQGANDMRAQNAINALTAAGVPVEQALAIIQAQLAGLDAAVPAFGSKGTESQSGKSSGFSFGFSGSGKAGG